MSISIGGPIRLSTANSVPTIGLNDLTDVTLIAPLTDGQFLGYNGTNGQWENLTVSLPANTVPGTYTKVTVTDKGIVTVGANPTTLAGYNITDAQPLDGDLTAIAALAGTTGFLKKTAANTWTLDTTTLGTAATANVTTSPTDTTSGRVWRTNDLVKTTSNLDSTAGSILKIADFGLGGTAPLPTPNDLDTAAGDMETGFYHYEPTTLGLPVASSYGSLIHIRRASSGGEVRFAMRDGDTASSVRAYMQSRSTGAWQQWVEFWHTGNLVKTTSSSDTTAGSMLKVGDFGLGGDGVLSNDWDVITAGGLYYNNSGSAVGIPMAAAPIAMIHVRAGTTSAIQHAWRTTSDFSWVRRRTGSAWQPWVQIWTTGNTSADVQTLLGSANNAAILTNIGAQPLDADLTAIGALAGTTGLLRKTAANTWSLDTASYITGNQTTTLSGDVTGSGTTAIATTLANSGVTAGTYKSVTVDAKGRVTAGTNPTTFAGFGIVDGLDSLSDVTITTNTAGELLKWSGTAWINNTLAEAGIQSILGFTPVQQGGGIGQITNKVYIGWTSGAGLKCTVDSTDLGSFIFGIKSQAATATTVAERDASGVITAAAFNTTSTKHSKKAIKPLRKSYIKRFSQLQAKEYNRKDSSRHEFGFIAEEVVEIYPEIVALDSNGLPSGIDYGKLSTILTAKVQDQQKTIDALSKQVTLIMDILNGK